MPRQIASGMVSYIYNTDGTLQSKTDANNNTETYFYDLYQRLTSIPDRQQTFCTSAAGHLVEAVFATGVGSDQLSFQYDYTYSPAGKVASKTLTLQSMAHKSAQQVPANGSLTANYTYDNQGALATATGATQSVFSYTVDSLERVTGMTDNSNHTWASNVTYNPANQMLFDGIQTWTFGQWLQGDCGAKK